MSLGVCIQTANAQILKEINKHIPKKVKAGFTEDEAAKAIKEALVKGTGSGVEIVSKTNGYFKSSEIKIPLPPEAKKVEKKLRAIGMGKKVDDAVLAINRAAEDAATEAKPIFVAAIKSMSIADAINIVKGEEHAATQYLKRTTTKELKVKFKPVIKSSLQKTNATKYWKDMMTAYNKIPMVKKVNPDLTDYATDKAIEGLFVMIAKEEEKIRENPMARTSDLLKKVFGK